MIVAQAVGRVLASLGCDAAFGVVGSGNFHVTNALIEHGVRYVAARHEAGAATMADAYARLSGTVGLLTVHQGPGLTNTITGLAEAAKSRTPMIVLAGEATDPRSNFAVDQEALVRAVGGVAARVRSGHTCVEKTIAAYRTAVRDRTVVLLNLPLDVQEEQVPWDGVMGEFYEQLIQGADVSPAQPALAAGPRTLERTAVEALADMLATAERPVFIAGRGARHARAELEELAGRTGVLLATSAVARGLFRGSPWDLDVSGGFATPLAAELIGAADVIVGWGCALNMWTTRHGRLIGPRTKVVQVDVEMAALGRQRTVHLPIRGEVSAVASAVSRALDDRRGRLDEQGGAPEPGYRSPDLAERIAGQGRWRAVPYEDESGGGRIDPRTLTIGLDDLLPAERVIATDSGNFMGYPAMFLEVPDEQGFCFTQAFQSIGLGLATAVGAALARPDRLPVAALGDGGALMGVSELETVVRLGLPMVIVVYDDEGYGAEVHHFVGRPLQTVTFPPVDFAELAKGYGCAAVTVTDAGDLSGVAEWLKGPRERPLLVHAKVTRERGSWWLEEAFRGH
ncbi:thiamine pyrophosphate-binding protein [Nonomuraea sp. NPDC050663]|uniref:thiamine pyrophosphate-binding protein n=1 Tax=Nonomuraea sp. NPDC050663 TaxID=3364370 RepID=UPI0037B63AC3